MVVKILLQIIFFSSVFAQDFMEISWRSLDLEFKIIILDFKICFCVIEEVSIDKHMSKIFDFINKFDIFFLYNVLYFFYIFA